MVVRAADSVTFLRLASLAYKSTSKDDGNEFLEAFRAFVGEARFENVSKDVDVLFQYREEEEEEIEEEIKEEEEEEQQAIETPNENEEEPKESSESQESDSNRSTSSQ